MIYKGKEYKLTGKCKMCGACCIGNIIYIVNEKSEVIRVELANEDLDTKKHFCPSLDLKTMKCKIHDYKPCICEDYPRLFIELELFPECGFKWKCISTTNEPDTKLILTEDDKRYKDQKKEVL